MSRFTVNFKLRTAVFTTYYLNIKRGIELLDSFSIVNLIEGDSELSEARKLSKSILSGNTANISSTYRSQTSSKLTIDGNKYLSK